MTAIKCHDCSDAPLPGQRRCEPCQEAHRLASHLPKNTTLEQQALARVRRRCTAIKRDLDALAGLPEHEMAVKVVRECLHGQYSHRNDERPVAGLPRRTSA